MIRVLLAVDVQNLFFACRDQYGIRSKLDFETLRKAVAERQEDCSVVARAYMVTKEGHDDSKFITALERLGYTVRRRVVDPDKGNTDWDTGIASETMRDCDEFDVVAIASGDGDFVDLLSPLRTKGKRVEVLSFRADLSRELEAAADRVTILDDTFLWEGGSKNGRREGTRLP